MRRRIKNRSKPRIQKEEQTQRATERTSKINPTEKKIKKKEKGKERNQMKPDNNNNKKTLTRHFSLQSVATITIKNKLTQKHTNRKKTTTPARFLTFNGRRDFLGRARFPRFLPLAPFLSLGRGLEEEADSGSVSEKEREVYEVYEEWEVHV